MNLTRVESRIDLFALASAVLTLIMLGVYMAIVREQEDQPAWWFVAVLVIGALGAGYGSNGAAPGRNKALIIAGLLLVGAGVLGLLTIGLPILLAGVLCLVAAARSNSPAVGR